MNILLSFFFAASQEMIGFFRLIFNIFSRVVHRQQYVFEFDDVFYVKKWKSNCTFEHCFYENKETIIETINQFVRKRSFYHTKGIPHTLTMLVYGESGCGKTTFIKCVMNHFPEKHLVRIQCDDRMDMRRLYRLLHHFYVPFDNRIIVLENIHLVTTSTNVNYLHEILKEETNDRIIIMTTDFIEDVHRTLLRSIHLNIRCKKSSCADIKNIIEHYWETVSPEISSHMNHQLSPAEIINECRSSVNLMGTISLMESRVVKKESLWKDEFNALLPRCKLQCL